MKISPHELPGRHLAVVKTTTEELINEYAGNEVVLDQARRAYVCGHQALPYSQVVAAAQ